MRNSIASRPLRSSKSGQTESGNIWQQYDILAVPYLPNLFTIFMQNKYLTQNKLKYLAGLLYHINVIVFVDKESNEEI